MYYCHSDEVITKFNKEENKSGLITQLLTDYYNKDIDFLEGEKQIFLEKISINQSRIDNLLRIRKQKEKLKQEKLELERQTDESNKLLDSVLTYWKEGKISDKSYFSLFKGGKLIKSKAEKLLNGQTKK